MRVTGGVFRSRLLVAPKGLSTRPTTDRVREALFSILGSIDSLRVLDVFAGTGALGLEALSRGARSAVFVESAKPAVASLRKNIEALGVSGQTRVIAKRIENALKELTEERFDLVLCDPPWDEVPALGDVLIGLGGLLAEGGVLVLEHAKRTAPPTIRGLRMTDTRKYGDTQVSFFRP